MTHFFANWPPPSARGSKATLRLRPKPRPLSRCFLYNPFWINRYFTKPRNFHLKIIYKKYVSEWKEGKEAGVLSLTSFGLKLKNDEFANANFSSIGDKHITRYNTQFHWNIPNLVSGFKKLGLLDSGFVYSVDKESGGEGKVCF